ncbi:uncharacterized protein LOC128265977 [Drosophila gunungcola]|uniref:uncharacterized protein LOC128265977 n=1 Tax=Drosophila gunungcola TaxID=103775 RepID=UPI0022E3FB13|nr:uncharacterized protein LOC128265977 [Drosophila gunungcola]
MFAPVRGNKASKLRSEGKVERPAPIGPFWALTSTRGRAYLPAPTVNRGSEPTSLDTSPSRIPTIRRPSSIPTSRVPIRRLAGVPTRNTSPVRATPLEEVTSASACSLPLLLSSENTVADHERKPEVDKDSVKWTKSTTEAVIQPSSRKEKSHHRVIELNKVRLLKLQHKKLENLQTELMLKIRTLAPQRLQGVYKFVAVVVNEKCKVESVHDLKERCRAVVDSCFMLFYDHLQLIQKSKDEYEARNQHEKIRNKLNLKMNTIVEEIDQLCGPASKGGIFNESLYREIARLRLEKKHIESKFFIIKKEHCDQMNQLTSEYEANLADELAACDHTIRRRACGAAKIKLRMHHRLEEAHVGPDKARHSIDKQLAQIAFLVGELKEARELIVNLQQRQDVMDKGVMEKDLVIAELNEKYRNTMMQISKLKEALNIKSIESETQSQVEGRLNKEITKLREKIDLDQQKLTARNHLINSLQKTEQENRAKLDKMYCQVGEKNTLIIVPAGEVHANRSRGRRGREDTPISNDMTGGQDVSRPNGRFFEPLQHQLLQHQPSVSPRRHSRGYVIPSTRHSHRPHLQHPRNHH